MLIQAQSTKATREEMKLAREEQKADLSQQMARLEAIKSVLCFSEATSTDTCSLTDVCDPIVSCVPSDACSDGRDG